jgi:AcrR family transcriptional regulator
MPKVVPEYKELAKKRIIDAAYSIFYKRGYHNSTMDDIAGEVGVSKASLYSYFKSKEELLQAATNEYLTNSFNQYFYSNESLEPLEEIYHDLMNSIGLIQLNFEITALSSINENIRIINRDNYLKKLDTLKFFVENQQNKGNIRQDISAGIIAQLLNAIYTDISMQLIIGMDSTRVHESWKNSLSAVLEQNNKDKQKTLNKYFSGPLNQW